MEYFFFRIDCLLTSRHISQRQLCKAVGISPQSYTNYKSHDSLPPVQCVCKIAQYLNTTVEYLVAGIEPVNSQDKLSRIKAVLSSDNVSGPNYKNDFSDSIKRLCNANNVSQKDLSVACGWDSRYIENKIYHHSAFTIDEAVAIANYFRVSLYSLIDNTDAQEDSALYKEQINAIKEILNS